MRRVAIRHDASTYMHGRIVTDRNATHEKRIRVGRALGPLRVQPKLQFFLDMKVRTNTLNFDVLREFHIFSNA